MGLVLTLLKIDVLSAHEADRDPAIPRYRLPVILAAEILMKSVRKQKGRDFLD